MTTAPAKYDPELAALREDYPILADTVYMNSNSMGAMHRDAPAAMNAYFEAWRRDGVEAWGQWLEFVEQTGDAVAGLMGGAAGRTTLSQNVATFQAMVASGLDLSGPKNKVVSEALMFPNVLYVWDAFCRDAGAQLHLVPSDDGIDIPTERILDAIDDRTAMVTLSHAIYVSGALLDIEAIVRRAHEVDALVMVDVYQTLGTVPFDVTQWDADLVVGGSHKWLCGGPGTCFLYAKPDAAAKLSPRVTGWMGHAAPFGFEAPPMRYADDSRHFLAGTPPMPGFFVARHAYQAFEDIGMDRIRAHNLALSRRIIERAQAADLTVHSPLDDTKRTGFVAVEFGASQAASETLIAERYKHDWRPGCGLRIGPHFYNTEEDVDRFMDRVVELARAPG